MRIKLSLLAALSSLTLVGCGPVYKIDYEYKLPHNTQSRRCINRCLWQKNRCNASCQRRRDRCLADVREYNLIANENYNNCLRRANRIMSHRRHKKGMHGRPIPNIDCHHDLQYTSRCNVACDCTNTYNQCYTNCGGHVIPHKRCVAFCDKAA